MCLPALPVIAGAVSAAGSLMNGFMGMQAAGYEARVANRNADMQVEAARDSIDRGRDEARDFYRQLGQIKGQQRTALAANGIDTGFGTAGIVEDDTARGGAEDASNLYRNIHERTRGFEINAANYRSEAAAAKHRGRVGMINSVFEAGSSLMGGFQQQRGMRARLGISGA